MNYAFLVKAKSKLNAYIKPEDLSAKLEEKLYKSFSEALKEFMKAASGELSWLSSNPNEKESQKLIKAIQDQFKSIMIDGFSLVGDRLFGDYFKRSYAYGKNKILESVKKNDNPEPNDVDYSFTDKDLIAIKQQREYAVKFLREWYKRYSHYSGAGDIIAKHLEEYFEEGLTSDQMADKLSNDMNEIDIKMKHSYFNTIAQHWTFKLAQYGSISGYEEAGIEYAEVVAVIDGTTTAICRRMHGRIIPVKDMRNQLDQALENGGSRKKMEQIQPMVSHSRWNNELAEITSTKGLIDAGICMPPYHFNCRTRTVAYFMPVGKPEYKKTKGDKRHNFPELTDLEAKNAFDEIQRRVNSNTLPIQQELYEKHYIKHGYDEMGLTEKEYRISQINTIKNAKEKMIWIYQNKQNNKQDNKQYDEQNSKQDEKPPRVQFVYWDGKNVTFVNEGMTINDHYGSSKSWNKYYLRMGVKYEEI